ncbi:hypothetical protein Daesc_005024 [Daldinia eschscholtzii]|uniref:LITAF domain-containing protein n=1 Tax=Daldinia eschscholtzii TaxID=292717 RepID=A0AAX6MJ96_9PEZI
MSEKSPQSEGIVDTQTQVPPPVRAAPQPDLSKSEDQPDVIQVSAPAPISDIIVEEPSKPPNMVIRENRLPQIVQERDPPMATPLENLDGNSRWIDCPACKRRTRTVVTEEGEDMQTIVTVANITDGRVQVMLAQGRMQQPSVYYQPGQDAK